MTPKRLEGIPGFAIDRVAEAAGFDLDVLRLENLDTDLRPPATVLAATHAAVGDDDSNSYLPFAGRLELRTAIAERLRAQTGRVYNADTEVVVTCGGTEGCIDALFALTDPGDEVVLTDPTYAGMINRVRLVGAVPRLVPFVAGTEWRLDLDALRAAVTDRTRALFLMSPSMPSGAVLNHEEWDAIEQVCVERSIWLIYNAAMERILFDGRPYMHPASLPGLRERTITVGSVSNEWCMIGWRIGWVAGPHGVMADVARAHIYNVVTPTGIAQAGAIAALRSPPGDVAERVAEWQRRRDAVVDELDGFPVRNAQGGWSLLLDVAQLGYDSFTASRMLLERGKIAATPMRDWGEANGDRYVRLVFSNEPVERLVDLRLRVGRVFG
jgi:aspartate/methionine/tyrosine aminotransferase